MPTFIDDEKNADWIKPAVNEDAYQVWCSGAVLVEPCCMRGLSKEEAEKEVLRCGRHYPNMQYFYRKQGEEERLYAGQRDTIELVGFPLTDQFPDPAFTCSRGIPLFPQGKEWSNKLHKPFYRIWAVVTGGEDVLTRIWMARQAATDLGLVVTEATIVGSDWWASGSGVEVESDTPDTPLAPSSTSCG